MKFQINNSCYNKRNDNEFESRVVHTCVNITLFFILILFIRNENDNFKKSLNLKYD